VREEKLIGQRDDLRLQARAVAEQQQELAAEAEASRQEAARLQELAARLQEDQAAVAAREAAAAGREQQLAADAVQLQQQREELQAQLEEVLVSKVFPMLALLHGCRQYAYVLSWPAAAAYTASWHGLCAGSQLQLWVWFASDQTLKNCSSLSCWRRGRCACFIRW